MRIKNLLVFAAVIGGACRSEPTAPVATEDASSQVLAQAASYTVINLGHLGTEENTEPAAINDAGQVVGSSVTSGGERHAFIWTNGVMRDLGTLGNTSLATDINASGQVIGESYPGGWPRAFLWQNGTMRDLGTLGGDVSRAWGINRDGDVVGQSTLSNGNVRAFIWRNGVMKRLQSMEAFYARAWGISNSGIVVGDFHRPGTKDHAFRWNAGAFRDLGTLGGRMSRADAINNAGTILGWSRTAAGAGRNFIYRDGRMRDIGDIDAADIGPGDQVVGTITRNGNPIAVVWRDGVLTRIGPGYGVGINGSGWIIVRRHTGTGTVAELYRPN
jgi:probable HAF family extracellular repeat protein